jgi:DNA-binding CsgD family transcriptional regulator
VSEEKTRLESLDHILYRRTNPAVLILDREDRLLYFNTESQAFLYRSSGNPEKDRADAPVVPEEITRLCNRLKSPVNSESFNFTLLRKDPGPLYAAKAHFLQPAGNQNRQDHIIVIIQPVVESHIDLKKVKELYGLSKREGEVLKLICSGCGNREISEQLYISEYTTRDHLKNIMRKMGVSSRNKVVALVI